MSDWGPEKACPQCGRSVQLYSGTNRQFPTTVVAGTLIRHYHYEPTAETRIIGCPDCGAHCVRTYDTLRDYRFGIAAQYGIDHLPEHKCRQPEPTPVAAPVKTEIVSRP